MSQTSPSDHPIIKKSHWRVIITAGMGFFTDAYDLFIIGVITAILIPIWHLSTLQISLLNGAALISAALGAVIFGWLSDKFGRKKMYGSEVLILCVGGIISACSPSFGFLFAFRLLMGIGVGGDYPGSAVVVSESVDPRRRGFFVLLVFAMQAVGLIVGPLLASGLLSTNINHNIVWRLLLAFGAISAISVFYLRRKISETPWYELSKSAPYEVSRVVSVLTEFKKINKRPTFSEQSLLSWKWLKCLIGTAGAWFLLDVAFYGNGISSMLILDHILPQATLVQHTLLSALIFLCFAVPGYAFSAKYVDKIGRKRLQMMGFFIMALCYFGIALLHHIEGHVVLFIALFGLSFFFVNFGPNATTFLIPSEIYPTNIRARAHGISAATGKIGAFVGAFFMPFMLNKVGLGFTMEMLALVSLLGILVTLLIPEMKGLSLGATEVQSSEK